MRRAVYAAAMPELGGQTGWEQLFWLVFERTSNPIVLLDDQLTIVDINAAALSLLAADRSLIGTSMSDRLTPAERLVAAREWKAIVRSREGSGARTLVRVDGSEVDVEFAARVAVIRGRETAIYVALTQSDSSFPHTSTVASQVPLTNREREIVTLIALGRRTAEIAEELHISPDTVRTHVRNAMSKLGAHSRAQLVAIVLSNGKTLQPL